ncbi:MAG: SUMF1/EgtB/PvdO family nonheme iron enzyme [Deltaproteobacteria bacterium]|nr:SUMF1/EgtB/PvdO family nonheme iron enzyme [Deltaproteobacteria bacterium]
MEDVDDDEQVDDEELEDVDVEELVEDEEPEDDDELEELEVVDEPDDGELEEVEFEDELVELSGDEEMGDAGYGEDETNKARVLAEEFNDALSSMDRFYNQYLLIPQGEYTIGSKKHVNEDRPERKVSIEAFYFGEFPVTNALFEVFVENTGYKTTAEILGYGVVYKGRYQKIMNDETGMEMFNWNSSLESNIVEGAFWYQPLGPGSTLYNKRSHPVIQVSLKDAMAFASWTGKRLPSEDEWEAASRTKKGYKYPWGKRFRKNACNIEESYIGDTTPVDQYKKYSNSLGIADTFGNVFEWTLDRAEPSLNGEPNLDFFIVKGRNWVSDKILGLSSRLKMESRKTSNILGFRCVAY